MCEIQKSLEFQESKWIYNNVLTCIKLESFYQGLPKGVKDIYETTNLGVGYNHWQEILCIYEAWTIYEISYDA